MAWGILTLLGVREWDPIMDKDIEETGKASDLNAIEAQNQGRWRR